MEDWEYYRIPRGADKVVGQKQFEDEVEIELEAEQINLDELLATERKKAREERIKEITNLVECASFSEDPDFVCKKILPISEMIATVKNPNTFYCTECYKRGLDMEEKAMGLRE